MDASLLQLMEELLQSIEQRDAGDPDAPAWEATIRIQRLEEELSRQIGRTGAPGPGSRDSGSVPLEARNDLLVGA